MKKFPLIFPAVLPGSLPPSRRGGHHGHGADHQNLLFECRDLHHAGGSRFYHGGETGRLGHRCLGGLHFAGHRVSRTDDHQNPHRGRDGGDGDLSVHRERRRRAGGRQRGQRPAHLGAGASGGCPEGSARRGHHALRGAPADSLGRECARHHTDDGSGGTDRETECHGPDL